MPLVLVHRDFTKISDDFLGSLRGIVPHVVSKILSCETFGDTGKLGPGDISMICHDYGPFDVWEKPLQITIFANHFPERALDLDQKAKEIGKEIFERTYGEIRGAPDPYDIFVWILLGTGGFWAVK